MLLLSMDYTSFTEVEFKTPPKVINDFWFGDSQLNAYPKQLLFSIEPKEVALIEKIIALSKQVKALQHEVDMLLNAPR